MKKKTIALAVAMVLTLTTVIGGTLAWLQTTSNEVKNTFTFGEIEIKLDESVVGEDGQIAQTGRTETGNEYDLIPGAKADKDPMVTVLEESEKCYVFVTVKEENNTITVNGTDVKIIDFDINEANWSLVDGTKNMYVYSKNDTKVVDASANDVTTESILATTVVKEGDTVKEDYNITVNSNLELSDIQTMKENKTTPEIKFNACAVQSDNIEYDEAVELAKELLEETLETNTNS